jgi:hypothetical protein
VVTAVSYHETVKVLQDLPFAGRGPFAHPDWFVQLEKAGFPPLVALAVDGDEALALPLTKAEGGLEALTNWYAFTWAPLATHEAPHDRLLLDLACSLKTRATRISLSKLPDEDGTAAALRQAFRRAGWFVSREACDANHILEVRGRSFAEYLQARPGPLRTTIQRKAHKVDVEIVQHFSLDSWQCYKNVYSNSWKPEEGNPVLLRAFAEAQGAAGRLRLGLARHDGRIVAAQFWTVEDGTAYIHKLAHLESARPLSAGTTLTAALLEHVIDRDRVTLVDFGTGDDPYKRDWMEQVRPRYRLTCWQPGNPASWPAIGKALARKLVSRARRG